ncbi:chlorophyllase [Actinoplanes sp. NPDC049118]|uniref:alpha/beta hydrolase family protein n=1 Tax=Actinoplanes sp. NPDC049118 TaxID=3155769 RepID=UPI0033E83832
MRQGAVALLIAVAALTSCSTESVSPPASAGAAATASTATKAPTATKTSATGAPAAAAPAGKAPSGNLPVKVRKLRLSRGKDRPLPTTVWYPATGEGPFPVIVFSHGLTARPGDYGRLLTRWAGAGFVVAGAAYPHTSAGVADFDVIDLINQPADASHVLTEVLALDTRAGDPLRGRLDGEHVAAAGHSGGGITTIGMLSGDRDDRLDAAVVLAGRQVLPVPFSGPAAPVFFVHGSLDRTVRYADGLAAFDAVPWPKAMLTIPDGGHVTTDGGDFSLVATATTDFWRWSLYGDTAAKRRLEGRRNVESDL